MRARQTAVRILATIVGIVAVVVMLGLWMRSCVDDRMTECEKAFNDYMAAPAGAPQPSILSEKWCFEHLTDEADQ